MKVLYCAQFDVKKISDLAMFVSRVADSVKLKIGVAQSRLRSLFAEFRALGELDSIGCGLHAVITDFARVSHGIQEERRHRRLAA